MAASVPSSVSQNVSTVYLSVGMVSRLQEASAAAPQSINPITVFFMFFRI
jgi:hypothetical protein